MNMEWPVSNADFNRIDGGELIEFANKNNTIEEFYNYTINFNKSAHILTEYLFEKPDIGKLDFYFLL